MSVPRVLTIAGSDSGGGAGIQADLKTFTALHVFGMSAITAVTAQNTLGVTGVHVLPGAMVAAQIDAVADDIGVDAVKTGMLANAEIVETVADAISRHRFDRVVVDPVMVATSGDPLLDVDAVDAVKSALVPRAYMVTPNIPEAETLTGISIAGDESVQEAARAIHGMGAQHVLIKGGHATGAEVVDWFFDGERGHPIRSKRLDTRNTHGTGCTLAAAIAAYVAKGESALDAARKGVDYVHGAIAAGFPLGKGRGPLNHFFL